MFVERQNIINMEAEKQKKLIKEIKVVLKQTNDYHFKIIKLEKYLECLDKLRLPVSTKRL